jgi:hypothetical protein
MGSGPSLLRNDLRDSVSRNSRRVAGVFHGHVRPPLARSRRLVSPPERQKETARKKNKELIQVLLLHGATHFGETVDEHILRDPH